MRLRDAPPGYDADDQRDMRSAILTADRENLKRGSALETLIVLNHTTGEEETIRWTSTGWEVVA